MIIVTVWVFPSRSGGEDAHHQSAHGKRRRGIKAQQTMIKTHVTYLGAREVVEVVACFSQKPRCAHDSWHISTRDVVRDAKQSSESSL